MQKMSVALDKCKNCMKREPEIVVWSVKQGLFGVGGTSTLKILCRQCWTTKKMEGTLYD